MPRAAAAPAVAAATPRAADSHAGAKTLSALPEDLAADAAADELEQESDRIPEELDDEEVLPDELAEESGLDLTDASDLDADNVPADEEFDRVMQAPD